VASWEQLLESNVAGPDDLDVPLNKVMPRPVTKFCAGIETV
jgi:hypothetical protein